jgi:hypothetical protein
MTFTLFSPFSKPFIISLQWMSFPAEEPDDCTSDLAKQPQLPFGSLTAIAEHTAASKTRILHGTAVFILFSPKDCVC